MVPVTATEESEAEHEPAASDVSTDSRVASETSVTAESTVRAWPGGTGPQSGAELPQPATSGAPGDEGAAQPDRERWREALRELEAAKERALREGERARQEARAELAGKIFPVLDGLDRSLASGVPTSGLMEGVRLVREQLAQVLSDFGVERIDAVGQPFDPKEHEAVDVVAVETPSEHHRVVEQWEAGYRQAGRVLRPAKVRVGKFVG
jgi:molecular chaperone GrpE